ncbi:Detected protein of confused Function [Hibiscus syriacus]|uniref:Detected protein of confused Function n=1 Tax=Hibiscus syriacus TaxID=106335 RepID=A0A6A2X4H8_HIBSY|nr:Detected protein of confused Function [Hibiscus syriacus]
MASSKPTASSDAHAQFLGASISREGSFSLPKDVANKSVDEVWKEIVAGGGGDQRQEGQLEEMTLEDFLTKAGAVREEDVGEVVNQVGVGAGVYPADPVVINGGGSQFPAFGNNGNVYHQPLVVVPAGGGAMRGKRRAVEEPPLDKATQQKQRRMIKNRESAARSRERKQAYTVELESMVSHLEEENARLLREEAELNRRGLSRYVTLFNLSIQLHYMMMLVPIDDTLRLTLTQLMKNLIPVMEKQRPRRVIRRVHSMEKCTAAAPYLFSCQFSVHN